MKDIFKVKNEVYKVLKSYIEASSQFNPYVLTRVVEKKLPLVVFEEARNELDKVSTNYDYTTRLINYNINIYATDIENRSSNEICDELAQLVINVMQGYYHMRGGIVANIPRFNGNSKTYQINLRFTTNYDLDYLKLY